jgi:hypothetical protein
MAIIPHRDLKRDTPDAQGPYTFWVIQTPSSPHPALATLTMTLRQPVFARKLHDLEAGRRQARRSAAEAIVE